MKRFIRRALSRLFNMKKALPEWITLHTGITTLVMRTSEGPMTFDVRDRGVGWMIAFAGGWEREESDRLREIVGQGDLVIDVGANIGWYTLLLSARVGETGLVLAFEPEPRNFGLLSENIRLNDRGGRVRAFEMALMSEDGDVEFELSDQNFGDHRVRRVPLDSTPALERYSEAARRVTTVRGRAMDSVLESETLGSRAIRLMKMDCQGAEPIVLAGAVRALERTAYLAIEYWPYGIRRAGVEPHDLIQRLARTFDSFAVLHHGGGLTAFSDISGLALHASSVREHTDYLFRNSALAMRPSGASTSTSGESS